MIQARPHNAARHRHQRRIKHHVLLPTASAVAFVAPPYADEDAGQDAQGVGADGDGA